MSNELREAVQRLTVGDLYTNYAGYQKAIRVSAAIADGVKVAEAWLADHPTDDDVPIDEAWLQSIGWVYQKAWVAWTNEGDAVCLVLFRTVYEPDVWTLQYETDFNWPVDLRARGQVRRLCRELGIELKASVPS